MRSECNVYMDNKPSLKTKSSIITCDGVLAL